MTADALNAWLAARLPARPASLADQMRRSIAACPAARLADAGSVADALGAVGLCALDSVAASTSTHDDLALELLAADAFVTYAFEAAAEEGRDIGPLAHALLAGAA